MSPLIQRMEYEGNEKDRNETLSQSYVGIRG